MSLPARDPAVPWNLLPISRFPSLILCLHLLRGEIHLNSFPAYVFPSSMVPPYLHLHLCNNSCLPRYNVTETAPRTVDSPIPFLPFPPFCLPYSFAALLPMHEPNRPPIHRIHWCSIIILLINVAFVFVMRS